MELKLVIGIENQNQQSPQQKCGKKLKKTKLKVVKLEQKTKNTECYGITSEMRRKPKKDGIESGDWNRKPKSTEHSRNDPKSMKAWNGNVNRNI